MSLRERFKHFRRKVKDGLGSLASLPGSTSSLPAHQVDPAPTPARGQSHSPTPLSSSHRLALRDESQIGIASGATRETLPPVVGVPTSFISPCRGSDPLGTQNDSAQMNISPEAHISTLSPNPPSPPTFSIRKTQSTPSQAATAGPKDVSVFSFIGDSDRTRSLDTTTGAQSPLANLDATYAASTVGKDQKIVAQSVGLQQGTQTKSLASNPQSTGSVAALGSEPTLLFPTHPSNSTTHASTRVTKAWRYFNGFQQVLNNATHVFTPLKIVMAELAGIFDMYEDAAEAQADYATLKDELEDLFGVLSDHFSNDVPLPMTKGMRNLCVAIKRELDMISNTEERGTVTRYLEANKDLEVVMKCYRRIQGHLERMKLNTNLTMVEMLQKQTTETLLKSLAPSMSAWYNSAQSDQVGRRECAPETRKKVLADLSQWRHDKTQEHMYWMNGMAGTGKTTIASSLCKMLDESHELGASFFCTRLLPECRKVELILPTVAYQLARFSHPFYHALSQALEQDPDLHTKSLPIQLEGLIIGPLRNAVAALPEHLIVVIDALDECEDYQGVGQLLEALARNVQSLPIRVFVSSRPEPQIRQKIGDPRSKLILHELEEAIVKEDIRLYLETELRALRGAISDTDLGMLVERVGVFFIYAATIVRYITTATGFRQQKRIRAILGSTTSGPSTTHSSIDLLYSKILTAAFDNPDLTKDEKQDMKLVLDTIVCAQEPLTAGALARLLGQESEKSVLETLEPLQSVLRVSGEGGPVTVLHGSFPDYMLDPERSQVHVCNKEKHNGNLTEWCFDRIEKNRKQFNICGIESSYLFDEQVTDLDQRVKLNIPQDLFYACRYWAAHLELGGPSMDRFQRITKFIDERLLLWMEILNLKKQMHVGSSVLQTTRIWCRDRDAPQATQDLIHDAWRFVTMFATNDIARSTAHLYFSMLASWPTSESFASRYRKQADGLIRVRGTGIEKRQLALLCVLKATKEVTTIGLSPDGKHIVSGSSDSTIRVWDAQTGKMLLDPLQGHTQLVSSVALSSNSERIVSGSDDNTIRVWDAQTGNSLLGPLKGHTNRVNSVAFSPDSLRIVSGSRDTTIRVWDSKAGKPLLGPLKGHTDSVNSIAFSPDGMCVVSGSKDKTIRVWDSQTGKPLLDPLEGHDSSVNSTAFSPDSKYIVSGSKDETIRVWDAQTGKLLLNPLKGHTDSVNSTVFSHDGKCIVSSSSDRTIRVWDPKTGELLLGPFIGHTGSVNSVIVSFDGMSIVSGSEDRTIRVWDAQTGKSRLDSLEGHTWSFNSVAFSPNGEHIVSGLYDSTVRVWGALTGKLLLGPLEGHTGPVWSVAYSSDGMRITSGSEDNTIRVWDAQTGKSLLDPFVGHTWAVNSVSFSPDGMRIVSGSSDDTIRVWDAQTGKSLVGPLEGHTDSVKSVSFSPNGERIASGSSDNTVRVWDAQTGKSLLDPLCGHTSSVKSVAFSPDSTRIVSGSSDMTIWVWDAQTGSPVLESLRGHSARVNSVAYSPDGMHIVSGSSNKTIRVWDAQTGTLLKCLEGHNNTVHSAVYSPDGIYIVSGSRDNTMRVWRSPTSITQNPKPSVHSHPSDWVLDDHGWVRDQEQRPLLWLPSDLCDRLVCPNMVYVNSADGSIELDFEGAKLGEDWMHCYTPASISDA